MLRVLIAILFALWIAPANAQLGLIGGSGNCRSQLALDSNGWTVYPSSHTMGSSAVGKTYYVSDSLGTDPGTANNVNAPWKTVAAAITQMKADAGGNFAKTDSWLLLKRGDIFPNQSIGGSFASIGGIDCLHPMVISSYDPSQPGVPDPYGNWTVSGITCTAGTATVTTSSAHSLAGAYQIVLTKTLPAGFNGKFSGTVTGASTLTFPITCPAASDTLHGIMALRRPVLSVARAGAAACGPKDAGNGSDFLIFSGIECYGPTYDPDNAAWDKAGYAQTMSTYTSAAATTYQRIENILTSFNFYNTYDSEPSGNNTTALNLTMYRNVNYYSFGSFFHGILNYNAIENYSFYDGWNPNLASGVSVSVATGTPGVITWGGSLNPLVGGSPNCSAIKFTGGTLPPEIVSGTEYYVTNPSGNTFNIASSCGGTPINLSGSPSSVVGYWFGTASFGFPGIFPQGGSCAGGCPHSYYIQNAATDVNGVWNINFRGNVIGFTAGSSLQGGGNSDQNVLFQGWTPLTSGKTGELASPNTYTNTNNGVFKVGQPFNAIPYSGGLGPLNTSGLVLGGRLGTNTAVNNLIAYEGGSGNAGLAYGIFPSDLLTYPVTATLSRNVVCGITTPIKPSQGLITGFDTLVGGSGFSEETTETTYNSPYAPVGQGGIPATGGSGYGLGLVLKVNGTTGQVSFVDFQYNMNGFGYRVGDIISSANTYIGGSGSGWSARVATVSAVGGVNTFNTLVGGSGYSASKIVSLTGGSGTAGQAIVVPGPHGCGSSCSIQAIYPYTGYGYTVGDVLTVSLSHTVNSTARVATVINNNLSNNTFKAADCNNLQSATGSGGTGQPNSVAPPNTPSASPPTDVIGSYFQSLAYGYQYTVPSMLVGQSTGYEQGYMHQASLQQKANWDTALMAKSILNWARPQFGMSNP